MEKTILNCLNREMRKDPATGQTGWRYIVRGIEWIDPNINKFICIGCRSPLRVHRGYGNDRHFLHQRGPKKLCSVFSETPPVIPPAGTDCGPAPTDA
jgi:hypothetical protein